MKKSKTMKLSWALAALMGLNPAALLAGDQEVSAFVNASRILGTNPEKEQDIKFEFLKLERADKTAAINHLLADFTKRTAPFGELIFSRSYDQFKYEKESYLALLALSEDSLFAKNKIERAIDELAVLTQSDDMATARDSTARLGRFFAFNKEKVREILRVALHHKEWAASTTAMHALSFMGAEVQSITPDLIEVALSSEDHQSEPAIRTLTAIGGEYARKNSDKLLPLFERHVSLASKTAEFFASVDPTNLKAIKVISHTALKPVFYENKRLIWPQTRAFDSLSKMQAAHGHILSTFAHGIKSSHPEVAEHALMGLINFKFEGKDLRQTIATDLINAVEYAGKKLSNEILEKSMAALNQRLSSLQLESEFAQKVFFFQVLRKLEERKVLNDHFNRDSGVKEEHANSAQAR